MEISQGPRAATRTLQPTNRSISKIESDINTINEDDVHIILETDYGNIQTEANEDATPMTERPLTNERESHVGLNSDMRRRAKSNATVQPNADGRQSMHSVTFSAGTHRGTEFNKIKREEEEETRSGGSSVDRLYCLCIKCSKFRCILCILVLFQALIVAVGILIALYLYLPMYNVGAVCFDPTLTDPGQLATTSPSVYHYKDIATF